METALINILKSIVFSCGFLFLVSCGETTIKNESVSTIETRQEIQKIQPEVKMVKIEGGNYQPFYGDNDTEIYVDDFLLDERPVTNQEFLEFVTKNPDWKRSNIKKIFADDTYLKNWQNDTTLPIDADPNAPITYVSWFAAKAYAKSVGKRLPTLDEWEYVAMADEKDKNARNKPGYSANLVNLYNQKNREIQPVAQSEPNIWGVYNMFDLIWEWTDDFNAIMTTNDSRTATYDDKGLFCAAAATSTTDVLNYAAFMRFAFRSSLKAKYTVAHLGFRCAKNP